MLRTLLLAAHALASQYEGAYGRAAMAPELRPYSLAEPSGAQCGEIVGQTYPYRWRGPNPTPSLVATARATRSLACPADPTCARSALQLARRAPTQRRELAPQLGVRVGERLVLARQLGACGRCAFGHLDGSVALRAELLCAARCRLHCL